MFKKLFLVLTILTFALEAEAQLIYQPKYIPNQSLQQYFQNEDMHLKRSVIYVFYNGTPCYNCQQTMDLINQIYHKYYTSLYDLHFVNYETDTEYDYMQAYNLTEPLSLVMVRVSDGAMFGAKKLTGLENQISDPVSFSDYLTEQINSFLGNG